MEKVQPSIRFPCSHDCILAVVSAFRVELIAFDETRALVSLLLSIFLEVVLFKMAVVAAHLQDVVDCIGP